MALEQVVVRETGRCLEALLLCPFLKSGAERVISNCWGLCFDL